MKPESIIDLIGYPDYALEGGLSCWEYDMDTTPPVTLEIYWGEDGVKEIKTISPAKWQTKHLREKVLSN